MAQRSKSVARSARRERNRPVPERPATLSAPTADSYQNLASRTGLGTDNVNSFGSYGFYPITRLRIILDWAYRSSWVCRVACEAIPEDMTREGFDLGSEMDPSDTELIYTAFNNTYDIWSKLCEAMTWGRLYGGAGAYIMMDGQRPDTPLRLETIGKDSFCGLLPLDRWLVQPSLNDLVIDQRSSDYGKPKFYRTVGDTPLPPSTNIHHSRFLRFPGATLPYYQRLSENLWDMSVLEPLWDRLLAFDMTTSGTSQLVNRASIRNLYLENWKEAVGTGGKLLDAQLAAIDWLRRYQTNEGISILDSKDRFEALTYTFTGLDLVLIQMAQQLAGALQVPLVRFFGQSPAGMNATGESDWRNYYDMIKSQQERKFRPKLEFLLRVVCASLGIKIPAGFSWSFRPLWQLTDTEKSSIASQNTQTVIQGYESGIVTERGLILKELKQQSHTTGVWTNITSEMIEAADAEPPMGMPGASQPPGPDQFLPGNDRPQESDFLPGEAEPQSSPRPSFLPGGNRTILGAGGEHETDAAGGLEGGELEAGSGRSKKPIFHVYVNDQDQPGRETEFAGHKIVVEVEKGDQRHTGSSGGAVMKAAYGYFPDTMANDGDSLDVFLGDKEGSNVVYVIETRNPDTKQYHQPKVFLGFANGETVLDTFWSFYADGRGRERFLRAIEFTAQDFKKWLDRFKVRQRATV